MSRENAIENKLNSMCEINLALIGLEREVLQRLSALELKVTNSNIGWSLETELTTNGVKRRKR